MATKQFNTRIQHKIDTWENWSKAENFKPLLGEIIIYTTDENGNEKIGLKIGNGDGITTVHNLPFVVGDSATGGGYVEVLQEILPNSNSPVASKALYEVFQGYKIRVASEAPQPGEVDENTITFVF